MTKFIPKNFLFLFILSLMANFISLSFAKISQADEVISRAVVEYKASDFGDPFKKRIFKEGEKTELSQKDGSMQTSVNFDSFKVQGIIWGGRMPQAIINNKVVTVGDIIDGAEILSIDKSGVTLVSSGVVGNLNAPGISSDLTKINKEDK